jgi:hypothetical protein
MKKLAARAISHFSFLNDKLEQRARAVNRQTVNNTTQITIDIGLHA